jgi:hypothetical protein
LLIEQVASIQLVESDFLATFKLLCSIHVNVKRKTNKVGWAKRTHPIGGSQLSGWAGRMRFVVTACALQEL